MLNEPKYIIIKKEIRGKILNKEYLLGEKIPSESELKEYYKVSRHTIREAIAELVNEGYLIKRQGSGTYVSDYYKSNILSTEPNGKKTIGVITTYLSDYIFPSIIRGIEEKLSEYEYSLLLYSTKNDVMNERIALESMIEQEVDGLIIEPTKSNLMNPNLNYYLSLAEKQIPLIMMHAGYEELDLPVISMGDTEAGRIATNHLIEKGHTTIGMITKSDDIQGKHRLKGYLSALYDAKLSFSGDSILQFDTESKSNLPQLIQSMLSKESLPSAFVTYNDEIAVILIEELNKQDLRCPEEISIVSHDNSFISDRLSSVKLTSVNHPKEEMGRVAAELVVNAIDKKVPIQPYVFKPELVVRDSTIILEDLDGE